MANRRRCVHCDHPNFHFLQTEHLLFLNNTSYRTARSFLFLHSKILTCFWKFFTCSCSSDTVDSSSSRFLISVLITSETSFLIWSFNSLRNSSFSSSKFVISILQFCCYSWYNNLTNQISSIANSSTFTTFK